MSEPNRLPRFQALLDQVREVLGTARELNELAEGVASRTVGSVPMPTKDPQPIQSPPAGAVTEQLASYLSMIHRELGEARAHVARLGNELPAAPDRGPVPGTLGR